MPSARERHELRRRSFDADPALYERARPRYPEPLFDDLVRITGVGQGSCVLEIGPGPGEATLPLARRGLSLTCLELSPRMARRCRQNLRDYPHVRVHALAFEDWPVQPETFDLVFSASAFHWIPRRVGFSHSAQALKTGGHLALVWLFREDQSDPLSLELHEVYRRLGLKPWRARDPEPRIERQRKAIQNSGRFGPVSVLRYPGTHDYSARNYVALLRTMSDHAIMPALTRRRLFSGIRRVFARHGDTHTRRFTTCLLLAPKKPARGS